MAANVTKRVTGQVTGLTVSRDGAKVKASWKIPSYMTSENRADRAEWLDAEIDFEREGVKKQAGDVWSTGSGSAYPGPPAKTLDYTGYDYNWVKGLALATSVEKPYDRSRFHPVQPGKFCKKVNVGVHGGNSSGVGGWDASSLTASGRGPIAWASYDFEKPRKPTVTWDYDPSTAKATVTVATNAGTDKYERYDTMVMVKIRKQDGTEETNLAWTATTSTSWTRTIDLSSYITDLQAGKWVSVRCWAYARGMAGDNPASDAAVFAERNVVFPVPSAAGTPTCDRKAATGRVMVPVTRNGWWVTVQLQRKVGSGSWSDVSGATDNFEKGTIALYDSYGDANPSDGEHVYYRIKTTRDNYTAYSEPVRADCMYTAKAPLTCGASVGIASAVPALAGTSATVVMGFSDTTSNTGCELSWSDNPDAWNSTTPPSTATFTGQDTTSASDAWPKTKTATLSGLTAGTTYYLRVRRYRTVGSETAYSGYSEAFPVRPAGAENDECAVVSAVPTSDGATVVIGIDEDSANTGTEVSWSSYEHAWTSNSEPEQLMATWACDSTSQSGDWTKTQTVHLTGLAPGTQYWIKARRYLESGSSTTYGEWSELATFSTPAGGTSTDVRCGIVSCTAGDDGRSAVVTVGWDGQHSGCEVSWSEDPNAWESNEQPKSVSFAWADEQSASASWGHTSTVRLVNLEPGTTYYVRARCWFDGTSTAWSAYTAHEDVTPYTSPASVDLDAPSTVARGEAIEVSWTVEADTDQVEWHIHASSSPKTSLAEGTGSLCRATIPADRYGSAASVSFYVEVGCGGGLTASNTVSVAIADAPTLSVECDGVLTAQPASFTATCDDPSATLLATCRAAGISVAGPAGDLGQLAGDAVWTAAVTPAWEASGNAYEAQVELPVCDFWDGGAYTVEVRAVEPVAGLVSETAVAPFSVEWAHQAPAPSAAIELSPDPLDLTVRIVLAAPTDAAEGDAYDLYRRTPTGHELVAEGLALGAEVTDPYAPYGEKADLHYRICCTTADGDFEFDDFEYELDGPGMRLDFDGMALELDYNAGVHESYRKAHATRAHADGEVNGYYEKAVEMEGSVDAVTVKLDDLVQADLVRALGDHAGPVFCRTREGVAMQCDAEVGELGPSSSPALAAVRISLVREKTTDEFAVKGGAGV